VVGLFVWQFTGLGLVELVWFLFKTSREELGLRSVGLWLWLRLGLRLALVGGKTVKAWIY